MPNLAEIVDDVDRATKRDIYEAVRGSYLDTVYGYYVCESHTADRSVGPEDFLDFWGYLSEDEKMRFIRLALND